MVFEKKSSGLRYYFCFSLLDTLTFDQHMLFFSDVFNGFLLVGYSTLNWK